MLRFLHLSDIHFDAVYGRYPEVVRSALKSGVKKAFENAMNFAIEEALDFVIISGDLCDRSEVSYQTESFLRKQFNRLEEAVISVVLLHGNHDPSELLRWRELGQNIHIATVPEPILIDIKTQSGNNVNVHANGFEQKVEKHSQIDAFPMNAKDGYHIGAIHTFTVGGSTTSEHDPYMQTTLSELAAKQYDYWALGHIHKMQMWPEYKVAYSGGLQGLSPNEIGPKGGILVEIDEPGMQPSMSFIDFSVLEFDTIYIDVDGIDDSIHDLSKVILTNISNYKMEKFAESRAKSLLIRVVLEGSTNLYENLKKSQVLDELTNEIREETQVLSVEIQVDRVMPYINKAEFVSASPFSSYIQNMLVDSDLRNELLDFAKSGQFAEMPDSDDDSAVWLNDLLDQVGEEWLYRMVKSYED